VKTNETGKIAFASTGIEAPLMTGRGGMKILFPTAPKPTPQTVNTSAITLGSTASLGSGNTVHVITMRPDGTELHEIITADVNEKRRRNELGKGTKLPETNPHTTDTELPHIRPTQQSSPPIQPAQSTGQTDVPMTDAQPKEKKYRLGSELRETVPITEIAEKIMNTSINLSLKEVFAASPDLAAHFSDQARKRRRPIDPPETNVNNNVNNINNAGTPDINAHVSSISSKPLYACPSGRAKATLEDTITTHALLDDGSEVNLMPRRVFEQLDIPIDTNIDWTIDGYQGAKEYEDTSQLIGVCHATKVSIGGVAAVIPVFVVKDSTADLILGRPWSRYVRATFINEDDESYTCIIRSPDGRRIVRFQAAPAVHERNRAYARFPENGTVGAEWGKV
jgi:hypothetical protein